MFAGEMQGTVHRLLLESHHGELKPGAVLLLKQVWRWGTDQGSSHHDVALVKRALRNRK